MFVGSYRILLVFLCSFFFPFSLAQMIESTENLVFIKEGAFIFTNTISQTDYLHTGDDLAIYITEGTITNIGKNAVIVVESKETPLKQIFKTKNNVAKKNSGIHKSNSTGKENLKSENIVFENSGSKTALSFIASKLAAVGISNTNNSLFITPAVNYQLYTEPYFSIKIEREYSSFIFIDFSDSINIRPPPFIA